MRGESHRMLGEYLVRRYMADVPDVYVRAFLFGCIQPDKNPVTYLKGSFREQWLRGHNFRNARRFMHRISCRLERKCRLRLFDYYTLGKLIHYTTDAFTSAHNEDFPESLRLHQKYEHSLQEYFLPYLQQVPSVEVHAGRSIMESIRRFHREYRLADTDICRDARYALHASCCVMAHLFPIPTS